MICRDHACSSCERRNLFPSLPAHRAAIVLPHEFFPLGRREAPLGAGQSRSAALRKDMTIAVFAGREICSVASPRERAVRKPSLAEIAGTFRIRVRELLPRATTTRFERLGSPKRTACTYCSNAHRCAERTPSSASSTSMKRLGESAPPHSLSRTPDEARHASRARTHPSTP